MSKTALVTGSCGLVGSEVCRYFGALGWMVVGIDNGNRSLFFGDSGRTVNHWLLNQPQYHHWDTDITLASAVAGVVKVSKPDMIVHAAAQPSHDLAASMPLSDFYTNAVGTLNMLEAARQFCTETPFVFLSTNKVYGDKPNDQPVFEWEKRYEHRPEWIGQAVAPEYHGVSEKLSIDQSMHSLFGVSKASADLLVQEYGRYFGMPTCCLRCGCLTGPNHAGVELHGFLSYLVKCNVTSTEYNVYGYKGKQVRDNLHAYDVATFIHEFQKAPRVAEVYNLGGGYENSCSILEAFEYARARTGKPQVWKYVDQPRKGDHICYYSDLTKCKAHYPAWGVTKSLPVIFEEIAAAWKERLGK